MKMARHPRTGRSVPYPGYLNRACQEICGRCDYDCRDCELVIEDDEGDDRTTIEEIDRTFALFGTLSPQDIQRLIALARAVRGAEPADEPVGIPEDSLPAFPEDESEE